MQLLLVRKFLYISLKTPGLIDTRLTRPKEGGAFIEVEGQKVTLGIPGQQLTGRNDGIPLRRSGTPEEAAGREFNEFVVDS